MKKLDGIDGFPTVDGARRPVVTWKIQFRYSVDEDWIDLGKLRWSTKDLATEVIAHVNRTWYEGGKGLEMRVAVADVVGMR